MKIEINLENEQRKLLIAAKRGDREVFLQTLDMYDCLISEY
jgi:hypothetical protein